jgi:hypothetical protein
MLAGVTAVSVLSGNLVAAGISGVLAAFLGFQVQSGAPTLCSSSNRLLLSGHLMDSWTSGLDPLGAVG